MSLLGAGAHVQLALAAVGVAVRAAHGLRRGHALGGAHAAPALRLADGTKLALPAAVWAGKGEKSELERCGRCWWIITEWWRCLGWGLNWFLAEFSELGLKLDFGGIVCVGI